MALPPISTLGISAIFALLIINCVNGTPRPCNLREFPDGFVCVCNTTFCDALDGKLIPSLEREAIVVSTSKGGLRFKVQQSFFGTKKSGSILVVNDPNEPTSSSGSFKATVKVNQNQTYQKIVGFGGAHTGTVTYLLQGMPQSLQDFVYESFYSPKRGIGYTITRIPIGGCDFDLAPWAYNELPEHDAALTNFTKLDQRDLDRIKQIKRLKKVSGQNEIKFLGTAWSPPKWMKTNNDWAGYSDLLPQYYKTWAEYHLKYLELMRKESIEYWGISTGNEPLNGLILGFEVPFMTLGWNPYDQAKWVGETLGPLLRNSSSKHVKLLGGDDQRYTFPWWFQTMNKVNQQSIEYLDGFAVHYYGDQFVTPTKLDEAHALFPEKMIINTESCTTALPGQHYTPILGSWDNAETYVESYLQDLNHYVSGWIDWNLILDQTGGPNYVNNTVDAPIILNAATNEFYKQPVFYAIGHFSRFVTESSVRVEVTSSHPNVTTVGFKRPDNRVVLVLHNKSDAVADVTVVDASLSTALIVPPKSVHTIVY